MGIQDKISDLTGDSDSAAIPRRQPDGEPPVPPVEIPGPAIPTDVGSVVTTEDLRDLLEAPDDASLVVEEGQARVVPETATADAIPILTQADLTTLVDGAGPDRSDETLGQLAAGLDAAAREQGV